MRGREAGRALRGGLRPLPERGDFFDGSVEVIRMSISLKSLALQALHPASPTPTGEGAREDAQSCTPRSERAQKGARSSAPRSIVLLLALPLLIALLTSPRRAGAELGLELEELRLQLSGAPLFSTSATEASSAPDALGALMLWCPLDDLWSLGGGGAVANQLMTQESNDPELLGSLSLRWALDVFTYVPYMTLDGFLGGGTARWALGSSLGVERLLGARWRLGAGLQLHRWSGDSSSSLWRWGPTLTVAYQPFF